MSPTRFVTAPAVFLAVVILASSWAPSPVLADDPTPWPQGEPPPMCADHPCPGDAYEVIYRVSDGRIMSLVQYDPCGPPWFDCDAKKPVTILAGGEAWVNLAGNPIVGEIMKDIENYKVDVNTLNVVGPLKSTAPSSEATSQPAATNEAGGLGLAGILVRYLLPAIGLSAMVIVVGQGIRRRREMP